MTFAEMDHVLFCREGIYTAQVFSVSPHHRFLFIIILLSATRSMKTRQKNKSTNPGAPDMTPSQLRSAGLSHTTNARPPSTTSKKPTKDQQIAALKNELRAAQELISSVNYFPLLSSQHAHKSVSFIDPFRPVHGTK